MVGTTLEQVFHDQWGRVLAALTGSPVVELSRAVAIAEAQGPFRRALALVHDPAERRLLQRRLAELDTAAGQ